MREQGAGGGRHRVRLDWRGKLAGVLLGFVAGGAAVNLLADDYRYRGLTAAGAAGAVLATASWLRRLPPRAPLSRNATRFLLLAALPALLLETAGPVAWQPWAVAVAAALTVTAVLIPTDPQTATSLLSGVAMIGGGAAIAAGGISELPWWDTPFWTESMSLTAYTGFGVAFVVGGVSRLTGRDTLSGVAAIGGGVACAAAGGVVWLAEGDTLYGVSLIGGGVAFVVGGVSWLTDSDTLSGVAAMVGGVAFVVNGVALPTGGDPLAWVIAMVYWVVIGAAFVVGGISRLTGRDTLYGVAATGGGVVFAAFGVVWLAEGDTLYGVSWIGGGVAVAFAGVLALNRGGTRDQIGAWWDRVTSDPAELPGTGGPAFGDAARLAPKPRMAGEPVGPAQLRPPT
jgi:hypothetical protein